ncbi:vesicular glutamate transporter 3-like [Babylonia areolata]|uniref:vesicular glutamate transporter 3-like n=1 Tax=Babylonia areolata TaxID=304850 RepID=UPI003FD0B2B5
MCCTCECCAQRYLVVILGFIGLLLSVGFRADFSLVMTHVAKTNLSSNDTNDFFISCPIYGSSEDWQVDWTQKLVQLFHTAYFAGSLVTQVPGGILAARFPPKRVCGVMILISSVLFTLLPWLAKKHWGYVMAIRALQGLVEGGSVPALAGVISAWAPKPERTRLLTIAYAGAYISPAVGFLAAGFSTCLLSWFSVFYICGGLGIIWSLVWLLVVYETPDTCPYLSQRERNTFAVHGVRVRAGNRNLAGNIPWRSMLTSLPVLAVFVGAFCRNWIFSMLITQQPQYFKDAFKMSTAQIGLWSSLPPLLMTISVICCGNLFDHLLTKGYIGRTLGRKLAQTIGFGSEGICILCLYFAEDYITAIILLCVGVGLSGFAMSGYQVNPLDLTPQYAALVTGIGRVGTIGGILSTMVAAELVDHTRQRWKELWLSAGIIHITGVILYDIFASGHLQPWDPSYADHADLIINRNNDRRPQQGQHHPQRPVAQEYDPLLAPVDGDRGEGFWERSLEDSLHLG